MGNFGGFRLTAFRGTREVLGLMEKEGSEHKCSERPLPQGWNIVNKDLFLPTLIVWSFTKAPRGWALSARLHSGTRATFQALTCQARGEWHKMKLDQ